MSLFKLKARKAVKKDLKKIPPQAAKEIVNKVLPNIAENPLIGLPLVGPLKGYFKFVFSFGGVSYRIVYQIYHQQKIVFVVAIGPREKFYERLIRRIG